MKALCLALGVIGGLALLLPGCQSGSPQVGSQTNWLRACDAPDVCGDLVCVCGTCTLGCDDDADCASLGSESCVLADDSAVTAACDGRRATVGMCLPRCDGDTLCPEGTSCVAGVCVASHPATVSVVVNPENKYQNLIGFGASLGLDENNIVEHPEKQGIFDAMFVNSGFEFVRIRNRFKGDNPEDLEPAREILDAAEQRLGHRPTIFMVGGSPPGPLKQNGVAFCTNADPDCTLRRDDNGDFDYAAFAEHWRASLEAYAAVGIVPDFVSIQNNPDWIPLDEASIEACRFLPEEGVGIVDAPDGAIEAEFPGYREALAAVVAAVETLPESYTFTGPESSEVATLDDYAGSDALGQVSALSYHLYQTDPQNIPFEDLAAVRTLSEDREQPTIQSEMSAPGMDTAVLAHHALVDAGSSGYLQLGFVVPTDDDGFGALVAMDDTSFEKHSAYYALSHFARFTEPGWTRIELGSDSEDRVLGSAWLSPDEEAMALVLINADTEPVDVEVVLPTELVPSLDQTTVTRTVFDGIERMAALGPVPEDTVLRLPARSVVTVATSRP